MIKLTLGDDPWIATITHRGNSNFAVHSIDSGGEDIDLLVNEIGNYNGTVPLNLTTNADDLRALTINADGSWKVVVKAAQKATRFTGTNSGKGPDVLVIPTGTLPDFATATITHKGRSNFVMRTYGSGVDLLVNEIGAYRGQIIIPNDTIIIEIQADGTWTIKLDK